MLTKFNTLSFTNLGVTLEQKKWVLVWGKDLFPVRVDFIFYFTYHSSYLFLLFPSMSLPQLLLSWNYLKWLKFNGSSIWIQFAPRSINPINSYPLLVFFDAIAQLVSSCCYLNWKELQNLFLQFLTFLSIVQCASLITLPLLYFLHDVAL